MRWYTSFGPGAEGGGGGDDEGSTLGGCERVTRG